MDVESTDRATDPGDPGNVRPGCHARTVSETYDFEARIEELAALVAPLGWKLPRVRDPAAARRCARGLHLAFVHVARGRRAIDVAIGEGLDALSIGSRAMDLGYSSPEDYAREELGINASTAAKMRRLARAVRDLPLIKGALRRGEISPRKAEIVAPVATRENEAMWLFRIKAQTVRSLRADVKALREPDEEEMVHFCAEVPKESQPLFDTALDLAGTVLGNPAATKMARVRAWCEEYQSGHPAPPDDRADVVLFTAEDARERIEEDLEKQHAQWPELEVELCVPAPQETAEIDPVRIDAELRGHLKKRERWDEVLGQIALIFQSARAWDLLGFGSFRQYCEEQLGMAERTVEQRASLERALQKTPLLRQALRDKRLSYEKARLIARHATPDRVPASIERAEKLTCIALRRELQDHEERQMCARGIFSAWMTVSVAEVVKAAFRTARAVAKRFLYAADCLLLIAAHFVDTWQHLLHKPNTLHHRVRARDRHLCQVPGCSRPASHNHHVRPRSQGGPDEEWNLVSLCAFHHLRGIHGGRIRSTGRAPDELIWEVGLRSYAATVA